MLDTGVFTFGVLANEYGVDIVVGGLEASDGPARTEVGEEVERATEGKIEGNVALSNRCLKSF